MTGKRTAIFALLVTLSGALLLAGCGGASLEQSSLEKQVKDKGGGDRPLGFPLLATKNTTRVPGKSAVEDAAAVATATYPGFEDSQRPQAVVLVDADDWRSGIAAAALAAPPLRAPILLTDGGGVPDATAGALDRLKPKGTPLERGAQAFRIGSAAAPKGLRTVAVRARDPFELAAAIDEAASRVSGQRSSSVMVAPAGDPRFAMPAAAWAAKSGDAVLFAGVDTLPASTRRALERRDQPSIYVIGPRSAIGDGVVRSLRRLGVVRRIAAATPASNAVAFARYSDGTFGWGLRDPGHGLAIANASRPLDAAAAATLATNGTYAPLLLTESAAVLPPSLRDFLLDVQPGFQTDPVRGVYNHAWLLGDESAIGGAMQAKVDELTEIVRVKPGQTR